VVVGPATEWTDYHGILELFGLRRSTAYHLVNNEPALKGASISLKSEHEVRGKRLFNVPKIRQYLNSKLENEQPAAAEKSNGGEHSLESL
jgi:hypothetical protein